jgi:hypothetical protein
VIAESFSISDLAEHDFPVDFITGENPIVAANTTMGERRMREVLAPYRRATRRNEPLSSLRGGSMRSSYCEELAF